MNAFPESPFGAVTRLDLEAVPLAVVRHSGIRVASLREAFDRGYSAIGASFADGTLVPTGPALAIYHGDPMDVFDLELGFPVEVPPSTPIEADGVRIVASTLPAGPAAATSALGAYDGLGEAWGAFVERALAEGLRPGGTSIEVYVSDPTEPADQLRTDLILTLS